MRMQAAHYHVNTFWPGCLNDAEEGPFASKRDAERAAAALAEDYREMGWRVRGNARQGGYLCYSDAQATGLRIAVEPCHEALCLEDA